MTLQERLLTFDELEAKIGVRYAADYLRKLWKAGKFPRPIQLSARKFVWRESAIDQWIDERERAGN